MIRFERKTEITKRYFITIRNTHIYIIYINVNVWVKVILYVYTVGAVRVSFCVIFTIIIIYYTIITLDKLPITVCMQHNKSVQQ